MLPVKKPTLLNSAIGGSGVTAAALAKLACPVCYPAVASLLSSVGLGTVITLSQLEIVAVALVSAALFGLFYKAKFRRGYGPFFFGLGALSFVVYGRVTGSDILFFSGLVSFISAAIWNLWPKKKINSCSQCADGQGSFIKPGAKGVFDMTAKRKIEVFSAGCPACEETIKLVKDNSCPSCEVTILDAKEQRTKERMKNMGIKSVPAVVIDGKLASCCSNRGPSLQELKAAGLGVK